MGERRGIGRLDGKEDDGDGDAAGGKDVTNEEMIDDRMWC